MHAGEIFLIILFNCILIFILFYYQKRLIEKNIKNLKKEIHELEDLVAAIIEEFEDIAETNRGQDEPVEFSGQLSEFAGMTPQELKLNYPTVGDFLDNMEGNEFGEMVQAVEDPKAPFNDENPAQKPVNISDDSLTENDVEANEPKDEFLESKKLITDTHEIAKEEPEDVNSGETGSITRGSKAEPEIRLESINDPRHRRILELRQQGITIEDIARQLGTGRGEIQLVLGLYRRS